MDVSEIRSGQSLYGTASARKNPGRPAASTAGQRAEACTVRISERAKALAQTAEVEKKEQSGIVAGRHEAGGGISDKVLPVEAYSLPGWFADYLTDYTLVDDEIGIAYPDSRKARYDALSSQEKRDLSEYHGKLMKYFREELRNQGIEGSEDYYTSIVLNKEGSEELHQAVRQRLADDPRAMELMEYFGVSL